MNVSCDVIADPDDDLRYFWIAEDDAGHRRRKLAAVNGAGAEDGADSNHVREVISSRLEVLVDAYLFHATLYCWAKNAVGTQREPCRYKFTLRRGKNAEDARASLAIIIVVLVCATVLVSVGLLATCVLLLLKRHRRKSRRLTMNARCKKLEHETYLTSDALPVMHKES